MININLVSKKLRKFILLSAEISPETMTINGAIVLAFQSQNIDVSQNKKSDENM